MYPFPIAGFLPLSLVDFPGTEAAVLFTQGCNLRCPFCHNADLIPVQAEKMDWSTVRERLLARRDLVDAVVITGGEPTLHAGLLPVLRELHQEKFCLKLDTNGTLPNVLQTVLSENLVDFVAMDVKAPFDQRMDSATGTKNMALRIRTSLGLLKASTIPWEVRTTFHAGIDSQALHDIAKDIGNVPIWAWQACRSTPQYTAPQYAPGWITEQRDAFSNDPNIRLRGWSLPNEK